MARGTFSASNFFDLGAAVQTAAPLTLACRFYANSLSSTPADLIQIAQAGGSNYFALEAMAISGTNYIVATALATTPGQALVSGVATGAWHQAAAVFTSATSRTAYYDTTSGSNGTSRTPASLDETTIGINQGAGATQAFDGYIAEVGIWDVALGSAAIATLAAGFTPPQVRPERLVFYAPMIRGSADRMGYTVTENGTVGVATHPRVFRKKFWQIAPPFTATGGSPVSVLLDTLTLAGTLEDTAVSPGAVSLLMETLTLLSSAEALTVAPGAVAAILNTLTLASSAEALTVLTGVAVLLDTLTLMGTLEDTAVSPGAVAVLIDTLQLLATIEDTAVLAGAVALLLNTLSLAATVEDLTLSVTVAVLLGSLTMAGSVPSLTAVPGATAVALDTLTLASTLPDLTATLAALLIQVLSAAVIVPAATAAAVTTPAATANAVEVPVGEVA
jgi:hypothetical protein